MSKRIQGPASLPPEFPPPGAELIRDPGSEYTALPPEYGQRTAPNEEASRGRSRLLRWLMALPIAALLLLIGLQPLAETGRETPADAPAETTLPAETEAASDPAAGTTAPAVTEPAETEPAETAPAETEAPLPEGSVVIDVSYAVLDGNTVRYLYSVYSPIPSLESEGSPKETPWPVSVYALVSDPEGRTAKPASDPDVWEGSRAAFEYEIGAADLSDELELTLTALYTEDGVDCRTSCTTPVTVLPPTPELSAELFRRGSGLIEVDASFRPQAGDEHVYDLEEKDLALIWYSQEGEAWARSQIWEDAALTFEPDPAGGFSAFYGGPAHFDYAPYGTAEYAVRIVLEDRSTGYSYTVESNRLELGWEPALTATLEVFPGGDVRYDAFFLPQPWDSSEYDLHVYHMDFHIYDGETQENFSFGGADPRTLPVIGDNENGYTVTYEGGSAAVLMTEGQECSVSLELIDNATGKTYSVESNRCPAPPPKEEETLYPLGNGTIRITVYNDTMNFEIPTRVEGDSEFTILAVETIPESEFTEYGLPSAWTPDGYDFAGWVVHVHNPFDAGAETDIFGEISGEPSLDMLINEDIYAFTVYGTLTKEDVERVPPNADGVRYVNIHAVWIKLEPDEICLFLDDGMGSVEEYGMESPIYSEGYLYLCNYPTPARSDLVFDGWYDEEGNRVDLLVNYYSFQPPLYDDEGNLIGYDWQSPPIPIHLIAHWRSQ